MLISALVYSETYTVQIFHGLSILLVPQRSVFHDFPALIATKEGTAANLWVQEVLLDTSQ